MSGIQSPPPTPSTSGREHFGARLYLFGSPRIEAEKFRVDAFPTRRSAYLLARLTLSEKRKMSRRDLAAALWPDEPYDATGPRLRQELTRLRKALGDGSSLLVADLVYVSLAPNALEADVDRFEKTLKQAKTVTGAERAPRLREAIEISGEPLLEGALEDWIVAERGRLTNLRYEALTELCEILMGEGESEEAVRLASEAIQLAPYREDAHRLQIQVLKQNGHVADALGKLQTLRRLAADSGRNRLVSFAEDLAEGIRNSQSPIVAPSRQNEIVGRSDESERLRSWLHPEHGKARLVTVLGPGGVGKTHLLTETCIALGRIYNGLVAQVDLSEIDQVNLAPDAIMAAMGQGYLPAADPHARLDSLFPKQPFLLALDNLEQFGASIAPLVSRLLRANTNLRIVASSRTPINLQEEFRLPLVPLRIPGEDDDREEAVRSPAVRLFVEMAENVGAKLSPTETDWASIFRIVRRLEGLPLGIRLAAPRLRSQRPAELLRLLESDPTRIAATEAGVPERHRSLRNALAGSFDLLSPELRQSAADLSVFRGGWTLDGAAKVCQFAAPEEVIDALLDASLIERVVEGGHLRFRMLESVREYAASLSSPVQKATLRRRHLDWLLESTDVWGGRPVDERTLALFTLLEKETDNLREAMRYALETDPDAAFRLAGNLGPYWFFRTSSYEANEIYQELFDRYGDLPASPAMLRAALGQSWIAHLILFPGRPDFYRRGIEIGRRLGDRSQEASFLALQGLYAQNSMHYEEGEEVMRAIEATSSEVGAGDAEGTIYRLKGLVAVYRGEIQEAIQLYRKSVKWFRSRGEVFGYASARLHLVLAAIEKGDLDLGEATLDGLLEDIQRIRFDSLVPAVHSIQGILDAGRGRYEEAIERFDVAFDLWMRQGSVFRAQQQRYERGRARFDQGRYLEAGRSFMEAAEGWVASNYPFAAAVALVGVSGSLWKLGEREKARRAMGAAQRQFAITQARIIESQLRFERQVLAEMGSDFDAGDLSVEEAIALAHASFRTLS